MEREKGKQGDPGYPQATNGDDLHREIRLQVQIAAKETAKLIGLIAEGLRKNDIHSPEYGTIRELGTTFLNELVRAAGRLDIQLQ